MRTDRVNPLGPWCADSPDTNPQPSEGSKTGRDGEVKPKPKK